MHDYCAQIVGITAAWTLAIAHFRDRARVHNQGMNINRQRYQSKCRATANHLA